MWPFTRTYYTQEQVDRLLSKVEDKYKKELDDSFKSFVKSFEENIKYFSRRTGREDGWTFSGFESILERYIKQIQYKISFNKVEEDSLRRDMQLARIKDASERLSDDFDNLEASLKKEILGKKYMQELIREINSLQVKGK